MLNKKSFFDILTAKTWTESNENYCAHSTLHDKSNSKNRDSLSRFVRDRRYILFYTRSFIDNSWTRSPMRLISGLTVQQTCPRLSAKFGEKWPIRFRVMSQRAPELLLWLKTLSDRSCDPNQMLSVCWSESLAPFLQKLWTESKPNDKETKW